MPSDDLLEWAQEYLKEYSAKYPIGTPCEDCGDFCKQQCYIWKKIEQRISEITDIKYPDNWTILNPQEYSKRIMIDSTIKLPKSYKRVYYK